MSRTYEMELVGGVLDGARVALKRRHDWIWVDVRTGHECYLNPQRYRVLYRRAQWREGLARVRDAYVWAGHTHAACGGCGAFVERVDGHVVSCSMCGGALAPHPATS